VGEAENSLLPSAEGKNTWSFTTGTVLPLTYPFNYPQCSCICVSVGSTVVLSSIAMRGFVVIISAQV
jgi:hypothetical protein